MPWSTLCTWHTCSYTHFKSCLLCILHCCTQQLLTAKISHKVTVLISNKELVSLCLHAISRRKKIRCIKPLIIKHSSKQNSTHIFEVTNLLATTNPDRIFWFPEELLLGRFPLWRTGAFPVMHRCSCDSISTKDVHVRYIQHMQLLHVVSGCSSNSLNRDETCFLELFFLTWKHL